MGDDFHVFSTLKHWEGALIREGVLIRDNTLPDLSYICLSVVNLGIAVGQGMGPRGEHALLLTLNRCTSTLLIKGVFLCRSDVQWCFPLFIFSLNIGFVGY